MLLLTRCRYPARNAALRGAIIAIVVSGCSFGFPGGQALASPVSCGDTITTDTTLGSDLGNCPNNGIVIGADNITLDLNGHKIDGDGTETAQCPPDEPCDVGIVNIDHHGVRIEDGTVREFALGALVVGARENRLTRLAVSNNLFSGLVIVESSGTEIDRTTVSGNGLTTDQAGVDVFDSHDLEIERNAVVGNGDIGLFLVGAENLSIERNSISGNPEAGILLDSGSGNELSRNRVSDNGDGLVVSGDGNVVTRNDVSDSVSPQGNGNGISLEGGTGNLIERNIVVHASQADIRIASFEQEGGPPTVGNTVSRNLVRDSDVDGVLVESTAVDTLLERNVAIGADDDGIDVENATTTLTRNLALQNGDLGIEAVPGVIDGGGNKAKANGDAAQCTNVSCK